MYIYIYIYIYIHLYIYIYIYIYIRAPVQNCSTDLLCFSDLPSGPLYKKVNVACVHRKPLFRTKGGVRFFGSFVL